MSCKFIIFLVLGAEENRRYHVIRSERSAAKEPDIQNWDPHLIWGSTFLISENASTIIIKHIWRSTPASVHCLFKPNHNHHSSVSIAIYIASGVSLGVGDPIRVFGFCLCSIGSQGRRWAWRRHRRREHASGNMSLGELWVRVALRRSSSQKTSTPVTVLPSKSSTASRSSFIRWSNM